MRQTVFALIAGLSVLQASAAELNWMTDLPKAQAKAKAENKLVMLDFTGSDWCPPCKALHKNVLTSPTFESYAEKNLVLVQVDFPHQKAQSEELKKNNEALAKQFSVEGFPTVIVLNGQGKELKKQVGYGGQTPQDFVAELQKLKP